MSRDLIGIINTTSILLQDFVKNPAISDINMLTLLWNMARAQKVMTLGSTSSTYWSNANLSDRCQIDVDPVLCSLSG